MYKLYWSRNSGAFAPEAVMTLAGVPFEKIPVDLDGGEQDSEAFRRLNPLGQVPLLVLPDGVAMTESAAMVQHLVDRFPEAGLAPPAGSSERAIFDRWLLFMAVNVYGAILRLYYADRYSTDGGGAAGVKAAAAQALDRQFAILETAIGAGPYLQGSRYSAADLYLLMLAAWYPPSLDLAGIGRLYARLRAEAGIEAVCSAHFAN